MQNDLAHPLLAQPFRDSPKISTALAEVVQARGVIPKLAQVLQSCRNNGIPVVYATKERHPGIEQPTHPKIYRIAGDKQILVHGTWGAQVIDALKPEPNDIVLPRFTSIDPSYGSELWGVLERLEVKTLIVAGVSTTFAVEGTVRAAANRGYHVVVLEDCCAGVPHEWHEFSVRNVLPLIATVASSDDLRAELG